MAVRKKSAKNEISLLVALKELCGEREISPEILYDAIESALVFAYKKNNGADREVIVDLNRETGNFKMFELRTVVEEVADESKEISLTEAQKLNPNYVVGDCVRHEISPSDFGRIAAQAAKQFVVQKIREAERGVIYDEFNDRAEDIVTGTVERVEEGNLILTVDKTEAILVPSEQIRGEVFQIGDRVKAYVAEVRKIGKGPQIFLSRTHPGFLKRLLEMEVPEVQEGIISVKAIAREAGARAKIAVFSNDENVEPVGTCIGPRGMRIQNILNEIGEEKVDIVHWNADLDVFITRALAPANIVKLTEVPGTQRVVVVINDENLAQAIGKNGQNVKLAATLVGRDLDVFGEKEWSEKDDAEKSEVMTPREQELRRSAHRAESLFANANPENGAEENSSEETQETSGEA